MNPGAVGSNPAANIALPKLHIVSPTAGISSLTTKKHGPITGTLSDAQLMTDVCSALSLSS
jgi:hypothetical protein